MLPSTIFVRSGAKSPQNFDKSLKFNKINRLTLFAETAINFIRYIIKRTNLSYRMPLKPRALNWGSFCAVYFRYSVQLLTCDRGKKLRKHMCYIVYGIFPRRSTINVSCAVSFNSDSFTVYFYCQQIILIVSEQHVWQK